MPNLLTMRGSTTSDGAVHVQMPSGWAGAVRSPEAATRVSEVVGEPVTLSPEDGVSHVDAGPVHLLTTASLAWLQARLPAVTVDRRRFRPNVLVDCETDGLVEEAWTGQDVRVGSARLRVDRRVVRCVTPALAQDDLERAPAIPRTLERDNEFCLGVYATVTEPGVMRVGDEVHIDDDASEG